MESIQFDKDNLRNENLFWPKWSEESINEVVWDPTKNVKSAAKTKEKARSKDKKLSKDVTIFLENQPTIFNDTEIVILPNQFLEAVMCWKRPSEFFPNTPADSLSSKVVVYSDTNYDLYEHNIHLESSSYFNHIVDSFETLKFYKDYQAEDFADFGFLQWKPSNHIYAMNRVVKGKPHDVGLNPFGKYIVRLYHCGKWRQITVDDRIPVNIKDQILLPCIRTEEHLELWPLLISKAILKINLHRILDDDHYYLDQQSTHQCRMYDDDTCKCKDIIPIRKYYIYNESDISRLNAVYLLTAWFPDEIEFSNKPSEKVWQKFNTILSKFQYSRVSEIARMDQTNRKNKTAISTTELLPDQRHPLITLDIMLQMNMRIRRPLYMEMICTQARSIPLEPTKEQPVPLPLWKTYRWMYWATEKDKWKPADEKMHWSVLCAASKSRHNRIDHLFEKEWAQKFYNSNRASNNQSRLLSGTESKKTKSRKSLAKQSKGNIAKTEETEKTEKIDGDPKYWLDFNKMIHSLECLKIYLKDHQFTTNIFISNELDPVQEAAKGKKAATIAPKKDQKHDPKSTGKDDADTENPSITRIYSEGNTTLYLFVDQTEGHDAVLDLTVMRHDRHMPEMKIKIEYYQWNCFKQKQFTTISTLSATGQRVSIPPGRTVFRIKNQCYNYCFHMKSNSGRMKIVSYPEIFEMMNSDSYQFDNYLKQLQKNVQLYLSSIGQDIFLDNMFEFYSSLMEYCIKPHKYIPEIRNYIQELMKNNFVTYVKNQGDMESCLLLRRLLILANWPCTPYPAPCRKIISQQIKEFNSIASKLCDCDGEPLPYSTSEKNQILNCAAVKIQSIMKMYYVKQLLRYHDPKEPNKARCAQFQKDILSVYSKYFVYGFEDLKNLIRFKISSDTFENFSQDHLLIPFTRTSTVGEMYEFQKDFHYSIRKLSSLHKLEAAQANKWHPLKVGCLFCHSDTLRRYMLHVTSPIPSNKAAFFIKIFNNDDMKALALTEIPNVWLLHKNRHGYRVYVYMFAYAELQNVSWSMDIIFPRNIAFAHFCNNCNDTMCPCDHEKPSTEPFPLLCKTQDLQNLEIFNDDGETTSKQILVCTYRLRIRETISVSIYISSSYELFEFEVKLLKSQTRHIVTNEVDFGKVAIVGALLRIPSEPRPYHKPTDFVLTISCVRRIRQTLERSNTPRPSELTLKSSKSLNDPRRSSIPDKFSWNVKITYDKGSNIEIQRIDSQMM